MEDREHGRPREGDRKGGTQRGREGMGCREHGRQRVWETESIGDREYGR